MPLDKAQTKGDRILLLIITLLLIILLPILVIVVRERTSFTGRAARTASFTCMNSKLYLLMMKTAQVDFSQYADSEREVAVLGEGSAGFMMNVGGNLVRRAVGIISVSSISWAD